MKSSTEHPTFTPLDEVGARFERKNRKVERRIIVCSGTGCVANGADEVYQAMVAAARARNMDIVTDLQKEDLDKKGLYFSKSGCQGFCQMGPLVTILPEGWLYTKVKVGDAEEIVARTLQAGEIIERLLFQDPRTKEKCRGVAEIAFYQKQHRMVLKHCGRIDPQNIEEFIACGGYRAAQKAVFQMQDEEICKTLMDAGLRGRGGGGFPTGLKWDLTRKQPGKKKYVICNGDEGDPGAFMDRSVMEGNPHSVIEGMLIASRAIGADEGYVYVRAEYPFAVTRMKQAVADARAYGILGQSIFGSGHAFDLQVMEGAGAFVCGEETALIASLEGKRGMPLPKPPFPAQSGLDGKPTVINNVETLASVSIIINEGVEAFRSVGTKNSPGTKTFALTGHVANTGLIEVPFGTTVREIIENIGGGMIDDLGNPDPNGFKAVQIGGPSGGCLTADHLDLALDFDSLKEVGAMIGSGGLVAMNKNTCMIGIANFFMQFTQNESCGKCVPCREGTKQLLSLLQSISDGEATVETLDLMQRLARTIQTASLCGLGKTAPNPVLSTMKHFYREYEAHVLHRYCPTQNCKALTKPEIDPEKCRGCTLCKRVCPVQAIAGNVREVHVIDAEKCIKCGACRTACKFNAVRGV